MSEKKIGVLNLSLLIACACAMILVIYITFVPDSVKTTNVTIEHLWEEEDKYYFADTNGTVFELVNYREANEKVLYNDMPKQRFEKLNEGNRYEIEYISGLDSWLSISEKEIEK